MLIRAVVTCQCYRSICISEYKLRINTFGIISDVSLHCTFCKQLYSAVVVDFGKIFAVIKSVVSDRCNTRSDCYGRQSSATFECAFGNDAVSRDLYRLHIIMGYEIYDIDRYRGRDNVVAAEKRIVPNSRYTLRNFDFRKRTATCKSILSYIGDTLPHIDFCQIGTIMKCEIPDRCHTVWYENRCDGLIGTESLIFYCGNRYPFMA